MYMCTSTSPPYLFVVCFEGDNRSTAEFIATSLNIPHAKVLADLLPVDKLEKVIKRDALYMYASLHIYTWHMPSKV